MSSEELFARAQKVIPGGVNSPVRAFQSVGGTPVYAKKGYGCRLLTEDGKELVDFCGSWGPLILGHAHPEVVKAINDATSDGTSFGMNTRREVELAELLCGTIPELEMVRLVSSGTEAVMTALRLARGFTKRSKILKFDGCYHGHADTMLIAAGSGLLTGGFASSAGVSEAVASDVFVAPYNDIEAVRAIVQEHGKELAAIIVEPVAGNMGLVLPAPNFLEELRRLTKDCGAVLIFDEVISGFRLGFGTYGASRKIKPDLICLGKIIGGGLPLGAFGGKKEIMQHLAPLGKVYQAGTLSGNPAAVAGGLATLRVLHREPPFTKLESLGKKLAEGFNSKARALKLSAHCAVLGGMFTVFWTNPPLTNLADVKKCDIKRYAQFFHGMLEHGFYLPPAQFEVAFISSAHGEQEIDAFVHAAEHELEKIAGGK